MQLSVWMKGVYCVRARACAQVCWLGLRGGEWKCVGGWGREEGREEGGEGGREGEGEGERERERE